MIDITCFENCYAVDPTPFRFPTWGEFVDFLEEESRQPSPSTDDDKKLTLCITPAVYREGTTRAKRNAMSWNWFAADIDNKTGNKDGATIADISQKCITEGVPFVIYTTTSSRNHSECFRLMFPLNRRIDADEYESVWSSLAAWLGCVDEQTKDISRLFVAPRAWDGADNRFERHDAGQPLDVDLMTLIHLPTAPQRPRRSLSGAFADTTGLKPVEPHQLSLSGDFVSTDALCKAQSREPGKRMFGFLVSVGTRAMMKGYAITADDLCDIGYQLAQSLGRDTSDIAHDASNAFEIALSHYSDAKAQRFEKLTKNKDYLNRWCKK